MKTVPQAGEVWFVDLGLVGKPRYVLVLAAKIDARLALGSVVLITTQFEDTPYEVTLPRVPWLREQSYINAQSLQPVGILHNLRLDCARGQTTGKAVRLNGMGHTSHLRRRHPARRKKSAGMGG